MRVTPKFDGYVEACVKVAYPLVGRFVSYLGDIRVVRRNVVERKEVPLLVIELDESIATNP